MAALLREERDLRICRLFSFGERNGLGWNTGQKCGLAHTNECLPPEVSGIRNGESHHRFIWKSVKIFIPDETVLYKMLIANYVTPDNIGAAQNNVVNFVGQIAEQLAKLNK